MTFRNLMRVIILLAATAALAQSGQPGGPRMSRQAPGGRRGPAANKAADPQSATAMRERVEDMESTLSKMRVALKQMQAKTGKSTDSVTKANLEMWELMVGQLDKELQQMRDALATREDLEARRASLYKQADEKAAAQLQAWRAAQAARFAQAQQNANGSQTSAPPGQNAEPSHPAQTAPAPPAAAPATNNSASPN